MHESGSSSFLGTLSLVGRLDSVAGVGVLGSSLCGGGSAGRLLITAGSGGATGTAGA